MTPLKRTIELVINHDLKKKIVLLTGPRQVGKTTLSKQLHKDAEHLNFDSLEDRKTILSRDWNRSSTLVIFDEIHKMKNWKTWLKGIYDKEGVKPQLLVTGSARLDVMKKMGDSLAGRYFSHTLHPLDIKELRKTLPPEQSLERLLQYSGFPEPFFTANETHYHRWRLTHLDIILRQDLLSIESVRNISQIETLILLMQERATKNISYANLARDLECDPKTVKNWFNLLENLYILFKVTPYSNNIAKSLLKEPKYYFYDVCRVEKGIGERLENLVALALIKEIDRIRDHFGRKGKLHYLQNKDKAEVDFLVSIEGLRPLMIEVKTSDTMRAPGFLTFGKYLKNPRAVQLVKNLPLKQQRTFEDGLELRNLEHWLMDFDLLEMLKIA